MHEFATVSPELDSGNNSQEISFMFARLLRDVFLSLEPNDEEKREFENWCRDEYLNLIHEKKENYDSAYTYYC